MRGTKATALRRATARWAAANGNNVTGYAEYTWHYSDARGIVRLGPCPRKLYQLAKRRYLNARRAV